MAQHFLAVIVIENFFEAYPLADQPCSRELLETRNLHCRSLCGALARFPQHFLHPFRQNRLTALRGHGSTG